MTGFDKLDPDSLDFENIIDDVSSKILSGRVLAWYKYHLIVQCQIWVIRTI